MKFMVISYNKDEQSTHYTVAVADNEEQARAAADQKFGEPTIAVAALSQVDLVNLSRSLDEDSTPARLSNLQLAAPLLNALGEPATLVYPGALQISTNSTTSVIFGTANGPIGYDVVDPWGDPIDIGPIKDHQPTLDPSSDPRTIATWIAEKLALLRRDQWI